MCWPGMLEHARYVVLAILTTAHDGGKALPEG